MMIKKDGVVTIIAGRESFQSAFRSGNRRTRNMAHRKLIEGMRKRGYTKNGKPRLVIPVIPEIKKFDPEKFAENPEMGWAQMAAGMEGMMQIFTKTVGELDETLEFWGNPDTGQRIPLNILISATDFWPLDEVLEMVPGTPSEKISFTVTFPIDKQEETS